MPLISGTMSNKINTAAKLNSVAPLFIVALQADLSVVFEIVVQLITDTKFDIRMMAINEPSTITAMFIIDMKSTMFSYSRVIIYKKTVLTRYSYPALGVSRSLDSSTKFPNCATAMPNRIERKAANWTYLYVNVA